MTLVKIDLGDVAGGHHPDDYVTIRAEAFRESSGGGVTSTAEVKIPLVNGVGQAEVEPGPVVVSFRCRAVADTREKRGVVPDTGTVGIEGVIAGAFEYTPTVIDNVSRLFDSIIAEKSTASVGFSANANKNVVLDSQGKLNIVTGQISRPSDAVNMEWVGNPARGVSTSGFSANAGKPVFLDSQGKLRGYTQAVTDPNDLTTKGYVDDYTRGVSTSGFSANANKPVFADNTGKLTATTGQITREQDVTSKGYVDDLALAPLQHRIRADTARKRHGYVVPTNGRGVVMLRFDDYPQDFATKVLPLLRKYDMPAYWAVTVRHVEQEQPTPWGTVQDWFLKDGVRLWNHSKTHSNSTSRTDIRDNIVGAADYFETQMPQVAIDGWVQPGTGANPPYNDFQANQQESYWGTYAGRLIMARHGIVNGGRVGYQQPMGGQPIAQSHYTFESATLAQFQAQVRVAQSGPYALSMMAHPDRIDVPVFEQQLAWLAAERDAGRIMVLTGDVATSLTAGGGQRHDLTPGFPTGSVATSLSLAVDTIPVGWVGGGSREFEVIVRASAAASVTLQIFGSGVSTQKQFSVPAGVTTIRKFFGVPKSTGTITLRVTKNTGGAVEVLQAHAWAA